jgi:protein-tyrosine phosphatase
MQPVKVLFVCLGNICRSPMAEGIFRKLVHERGLGDRILTDSAGTGPWHVNEPPDKRAQQEVAKYGIDISGLRARMLRSSDFEEFDYIVAMDSENLANLEERCPPGSENRLFRCAAFVPSLGKTEVPDPFFGGVEGFSAVFELVQVNAEALLDRIVQEHFAATG